MKNLGSGDIFFFVVIFSEFSDLVTTTSITRFGGGDDTVNSPSDMDGVVITDCSSSSKSSSDADAAQARLLLLFDVFVDVITDMKAIDETLAIEFRMNALLSS